MNGGLHFSPYKRQSRQEKLYQAKLESLELFVRVIAHDLNGPLTGMNLTLQAMRQIAKSTTLHKLIDSVERDLTSATDLLEELKSLNRRETYRLRQLDLAAELRAIIVQMKSLTNLPISIDFPETKDKLTIAGDVSRLRRVWQNIVYNVMDASETRKSPEQISLKVIAKKTGRYARVQFFDNAGGIPAAKLSRLFEPFYTTKGGKNRGLGLFIARKIVNEHHGKIRVASKKPYTRVTVDLPLAP